MLQYLVNSSLCLFYCTRGDDTQTLQATEDGTAETLLCLPQVERTAVGEVQRHVDDAGGIVAEGIEGLGVLERCAVVADVQDIDLANLVGHL